MLSEFLFMSSWILLTVGSLCIFPIAFTLQLLYLVKVIKYIWIPRGFFFGGIIIILLSIPSCILANYCMNVECCEK